jgi:uncharacterized membrane protein
MVDPLPLPKSRLEALTDGIFGVSMTLLVLDIKFPPHVFSMEASAWSAMGGLLALLDDYVVSFVALCVFWLAHLRLLRRLREADMPFVWLNLVFLLFTTFVPSLTALIGDNPGHPRAAVLYGANLAMILVFEMLMWERMCRKLANDTVHDAQALWGFVRMRFALALGIVVVAIAAALVEIRLGVSEGRASYVYLLLLGAAVVPRMLGGTPDRRGRADP